MFNASIAVKRYTGRRGASSASRSISARAPEVTVQSISVPPCGCTNATTSDFAGTQDTIGRRLIQRLMGLLENPSLLPFRPVPVPSPRSERASLASTARVQFLTTAVRSAVLFVFQWLLARAYGANAFGVCNTAQAGMQTATMLGRAAGDTVVLRAHDEDHLASGTTLSLLGGVAAAVTLAAWGLYFARGQQDVAPLIAFGLAAAAVPPATLLFPLGAGLQRQNRFRAYALVVTLLDPVV